MKRTRLTEEQIAFALRQPSLGNRLLATKEKWRQNPLDVVADPLIQVFSVTPTGF